MRRVSPQPWAAIRNAVGVEQEGTEPRREKTSRDAPAGGEH